ncbi:hypothetical protein [Bacillus sp. B-jedd]|uniref:hypothetical protein n=1 Tax=Bacillus sp. B-jedd TaxID=1476857 RepID=UPI00051568DF|nr:hypothetical protein [Bacillus sp. B-jedd]CEG27139.1 hypothetical protein BN1002_01995 [Bacillus sp. B-jedd]
MKGVFSDNIDIDKNAYINWRIERHNPIKNMLTIADGFMESSIMLAEQALKDNRDKKADIIIYPILFSANHAIELYLKAIGWTINILLENDKRVEGGHDIQQILNVVKSRVNEFEIDKDRKKAFKELINNLENYIKELFLKIETKDDGKNKDNMDFSRYPFDTKYVSHFYIETFDNVVVDLENFVERFKEIGQNLNQIASHYLYDFLLAENE